MDGQVGEISPGINSDYHSKELSFFFQSPFTYHEHYKYNHSKQQKKLVKSVKLHGPQIIRNEFDC